MAMKMKAVSATNSKEILAIPDHYVAIARKHAQATSDEAGIATLVDGRYIVKAGTIYPSNDENAIGIVMNDYDVTDGDKNMAVILHGFVRLDKLPAEPSEAAVAALPMVKFLGEEDVNYFANVKAVNDTLYAPVDAD